MGFSRRGFPAGTPGPAGPSSAPSSILFHTFDVSGPPGDRGCLSWLRWNLSIPSLPPKSRWLCRMPRRMTCWNGVLPGICPPIWRRSCQRSSRLSKSLIPILEFGSPTTIPTTNISCCDGGAFSDLRRKSKAYHANEKSVRAAGEIRIPPAILPRASQRTNLSGLILPGRWRGLPPFRRSHSDSRDR